jgi:hypothetical protein
VRGARPAPAAADHRDLDVLHAHLPAVSIVAYVDKYQNRPHADHATHGERRPKEARRDRQRPTRRPTVTRLDTAEAAPATETHRRPRAALPALCLTQITSWGVVSYAFPVLNARIAADTGWSMAATTAAFSGALLVSALVGIPIGRILDRRGPRAVMTWGSVLAVIALLAVAWSPNLAVFTAAWLLVGVAMAGPAPAAVDQLDILAGKRRSHRFNCP